MRKLLTALLLFSLLSTLFPAAVLADGEPFNALEDALIYPVSGGPRQFLLIDGIPVLLTPSYYMGTNSAGVATEYPAYCLHPDKPSPNEVGAYYVSTKDFVANPKVYGIITNGYPYKSVAELGLSSQDQAFYATGVALWTYLKGWLIDTITAADASQEATLAAMKTIYYAGMAVETIPSPILSAAANTSLAQPDALDSGYVSQTYTVTANMDIRSYEASITGQAPAGTFIADLSNNPKSVFNSGEQFKVLIPANQGTGASGHFEIMVNGQLKSNAVIYGLSYDDSIQDFGITRDPFSFEDATAISTYDIAGSGNGGDGDGDISGSTMLEIHKKAVGTNIPLPGAVIRVTHAEAGVIGTFTTDSNGRVVLPLQLPGPYQVEEISPPKGYVLSENSHQDVIVYLDRTTTVTFHNEAAASLELQKVDADSGARLNGAVIRLARQGGAGFTDLTTDVAGTALLSDLAPGTYTLQEIVAPDGYILDSTPQTLILEPGQRATVVLSNKAKPGLVIRKYDEDSGIVLAKAEFSVAKMGGQIVFEGMTDSNGTIRLEDLDEGWYTVTEIAPPQGYLIASESKNVYLEPNKTVEIKFDNRLRPALRITKLDEETGRPLAGAVFQVGKTEGEVFSEYTTDATGTILIHDLDEAIYTVTEIKAPDGYLLDAQPRQIQLTWGRIKGLAFTNKARPALEILKIDEESGKPLAGATFRVSTTEGGTIGEYITNTSGRILISDLDDLIYTVEEIVAPDGYLLETQHKDMKLEWGKTMQMVFTNKLRPALEILKVDAITGQPLAGARFRLTRTEDMTVSEFITDEEGRILITDLDEAVYTVEEIAAPNGYLFDAQKREIKLSWGTTKSIVFENIRKPTLIVTKTNALTFLPIVSATFTVEYEDAVGGLRMLGTYRTDAEGQIVLPLVEPGWYVITETVPAPGFSLPSQPITRKYLAPGENAYTAFSGEAEAGDISGEQLRITSGADYVLGQEVINYPLNSVVIRKVHAVTGELLAGATFSLRRASEEISGTSGTLIGQFTTDRSGVIVISGLQPGGYIVTEEQAPSNFLLSENAQQQVWLKPGGTSIVEATFANWPYGAILISKVDALTHQPLANARFRVTDSAGAVVGSSNGEFVSDANGEILIPNLKPGSYVITEIEAPAYYALDATPQTIEVGKDGKVYKVSFTNQPFATLVIRKLDSDTKEPLTGAEFKVTDSSGTAVGESNGIYRSDATGTITIPHLPKGSYIVQEMRAPLGYLLENQAQTIAIDVGKTYTLDFFNRKLSGLQIVKRDSRSKQPLKGAEFSIYRKSGERIGRYTTDADGLIILDQLEPGWIKIAETKAPEGYLIDDVPRDLEVTANQFLQVVFENHPQSSLQVRKVASGSLMPLEGAEFEVRKLGGQLVGNFRTGADGTFTIDALDPGWVTVTETKAPEGYLLDESQQTVEIGHSRAVVLTFRNQPIGSLVIRKIDEINGAPLAGAEFTITHQDGSFVAEVTTGTDGTIGLPGIEPGWYLISETKAPVGYQLDSTAKTVEVKPAVPSIATFTNKPLSGIEILKLDAITRTPLMSATFLVERSNGERIGSYTTDAAGKVIVSDLSEGTFVVSEVTAPDGYILDELPKTVEVHSGRLTTIEFFNKPLASLKIIKLNSVSRQPIEGVEFVIAKLNGERVENGFRGVTFKTDRTGQIVIPNLADGYYTVTETRTADGYLLDSEPRTVLVQSGKPTILEVLNTPLSGLLIVKTDAVSGEPLAGAVFDVQKADGQFVAGSILDANQPNTLNNSPNKTTSSNGDISGSYTTDNNGRILINGLEAGQYMVKERKAPQGYELDREVHSATVTPGKLTALQLTNQPKASLRLLKIDSISKAPIYGVEFMVFDSSGKQVGTFTTDNNGLIDFTDVLSEGRYTIRETRAAAGYDLDDMPRTVEFAAGKVTEIRWENSPQRGQIQILKLSADDNEVNGLAAGTPLAEAVFEAVDLRSGNIVDRFASDSDGRAVSSPLPLGRYLVREIEAPQWYILSNKELTLELEFAGQIVKQEFLNYAANTGVHIKKTGNIEAMSGDTIRYAIAAVQNTSTVPLSDFYWRDVLPVDAARLSTIVTGSYNQALRYKILAITNKGETRVLADNLSTTKNNVIDCSHAALGLRNDEFITSFSLVFGSVKAGFAQVEQPQVYLSVLRNLPHGYLFANKADIGGKYGEEWVVANSTWTTAIYANPGPLPKTGY